MHWTIYRLITVLSAAEFTQWSLLCKNTVLLVLPCSYTSVWLCARCWADDWNPRTTL